MNEGVEAITYASGEETFEDARKAKANAWRREAVSSIEQIKYEKRKPSFFESLKKVGETAGEYAVKGADVGGKAVSDVAEGTGRAVDYAGKKTAPVVRKVVSAYKKYESGRPARETAKAKALERQARIASARANIQRSQYAAETFREARRPAYGGYGGYGGGIGGMLGGQVGSNIFGGRLIGEALYDRPKQSSLNFGSRAKMPDLRMNVKMPSLPRVNKKAYGVRGLKF